MTFKDFIQRFFKGKVAKPKNGTGAIEDPRMPHEIEKDYLAKEVAAFAPVTWLQKPQADWRKFTIFNQDGSSSCVANGTAKILGVENFIEEKEFVNLSRRDIYSRRANMPGEGMYFKNALEIVCDKGATLETLMNSEGKSEAQMNVSSDRTVSKEQIALTFKGGGYVKFTEPYSIEEIASTIASGKAVLMGFRFNYNEWTERPSILTTTPELHHGVAGVDFALNAGEKCLIIEDSWGTQAGLNGQRVITEKFLKARCSYAGYILDLKNNWRDTPLVVPKPHLLFTADLKFGLTNESIKDLQNMLKYEEFFPVTQASSGYFGVLTAKGVLAWQLKHNENNALGTTEELTALEGKFFGPRSRALANQIYQ